MLETKSTKAQPKNDDVDNSKEVTKSNSAKTNKKTLRGVVVSTKMQDTVVVAVSRYVKHPKYKKYQKKVKRYHVHDKGNTTYVGDKVEIVETAPLSKTKKFKIVSSN